jgi:hypothetical protein
MKTKSSFPKITETREYLDIVFSDEPESRLFLHGPDQFIAVAQPGKKTVSPPIERVSGVTFAEGERLLIVEWKGSNGEIEKALFRGCDRATWEDLTEFVAKRIGDKFVMRERRTSDP